MMGFISICKQIYRIIYIEYIKHRVYRGKIRYSAYVYARIGNFVASVYKSVYRRCMYA